MSHGIVARYEHRRGHGNERKPLRRESEGRQCATMSLGACSSAPRWYSQWTESPLHSGLVGRPPATLKKRIPINGVPQRRRRVVIVGSLKKKQLLQPKILFSHKDCSKPNPITVRQAIAGLPMLATGSGDFETVCNYISTSNYEKYMLGEINFATFYETCLSGVPRVFRNAS